MIRSTVVAFLIGTANAVGSPVSMPITSLKMLDDMNIKIEHRDSESLDGKEKNVVFTVTWKPVQKEKDFPPRMDLLIFNGEGDNKRRVHIRYRVDGEGKCEADFTVLKSEVKNASLVFWNGQHTVHGFTIFDYLSGFKDNSPFANPFENKDK